MVDIGSSIDKNFTSIWPEWLMLMILRTRKINEVVGNPVDAIIVQVVCWHHLLVTSVEQDNDVQTFDEAIYNWHQGFSASSSYKKDKKLTITAISLSTAIPFETVRRRVKKLCDDGWLSIADNGGVNYSPTNENNEKIVNDIYMEERRLLTPFLKRVVKLTS